MTVRADISLKVVPSRLKQVKGFCLILDENMSEDSHVSILCQYNSNMNRNED